MNKLTKLLSVFVIAGAIGTGILGVAGCKKGGSESHTHNYTYTNKGATHDGACECGKDPITGQDHIWGPDNKCTAKGCDAVKPAETNVTGVTITAPEKTTIYVGDKITLTATVQAKAGTTVSQDVTWAIVSGGNYATINAATGELTATGLGSVYVVATSVDGEVDSSPLTITVEERNLYAELVADTENNVIGEDFEDVSDLNLTEGGRLPVYPGYTNTTPGLYEWGDRDAAADGCGVLVENGKAVHVTNGKNSSLIVDLTGEVKDVVEGYVELSVDNTGNDWAVLTLLGKFATSTNYEEVFAIRMATGGVMGYRIGGKDTGTVINSDSITFANDGTVYKVYYKLDMVSGLITVDITPAGGAKANLCTDVQTGIAELKGLMFVSSNSGGRLTTFDNIAVNSKTATLAEAQASLKAKLDDYVAKATVAADDGEYTLTLTGDGVTTAVNAVKTAIDNAADAAAAKAAYDTITVDAAILAQAKASADGLLKAYRSDEHFDGTEDGTDNNEEWAAAQAAGTAAINNSTSIELVRISLAEAIQACSIVLNDEDNAQPKANITFKLNDDSGAAVGTLNKAISGRKIELSKLIDSITANLYLKDVKIYTDADHQTEITAATGYTPTVAAGATEDLPVTLYVVITDIDNTGKKTVTVLESKPVVTGKYVSVEHDVDFNATDFKFSGSAKYVDLTIQARATQKIKVTVSGITGSSSSASGIKITAPVGVTADSNNPESVEFPVSKDVGTGSFIYTVNTTGDVVFRLNRVGATARLQNITIEVINADGEFEGGTTNPDTPDPTPGEATEHRYTYSYANIDKTTVADVTVQDANNNNADTVVKDNGAINAGPLSGTGNSFITVGSGVTYRDGETNLKKTDGSKNPACIENNGAGLSVTFQGTGTLTISFSSSGKTNNSRLGVKKSGTDTYLEATGTLPTGVTKVEAAEEKGDNTGTYNTLTTTSVTLTFNITEAGTYVIDCPSNVTGRGARIQGIVMVDNFADAQA